MTLMSLIKEFDCLLVPTAVSALVDSCGYLVGVVALVTLLGGPSQDFRSKSRPLRMLKSSLASLYITLLGFLTTYPDLGPSLPGLTSPFLLPASTFERDRDLALAGASLDACDGDVTFAVVILPSGSGVDALFLSSSSSNCD